MRYDKLPEHMQHGARDYIEKGVPPGSFLMAVLCNDLTQAFSRADDENRAAMFDWASWLWNECPRRAWGDRKTVDAWIASTQGRGRAL